MLLNGKEVTRASIKETSSLTFVGELLLSENGEKKMRKTVHKPHKIQVLMFARWKGVEF